MAEPFRFKAIGTSWQIDVYDDITQEKAAHLQQTVMNMAEDFDKAYSRFRPDSLVSQLARDGGSVTFPNNFAPLITWYKYLHDTTAGAVTPLIGDLLSDAGYDATYSLQPKPLRPAKTWQDVLRIDKTEVSVREPVILDFGAAGKGYLVDLMAIYLKEQGIAHYTVDGSGDLYHTSTDKTFRVGLEHPRNKQQVVGYVDLQNQALCGSASNRRTWGEYHHIIDPHSRKPAEEVVATWVVASTAMVADGLATALFFTAPEVLQKVIDFEYVIIDRNGRVTKSAALNGVIFGKVT